jgi:hypothetical protein
VPGAKEEDIEMGKTDPTRSTTSAVDAFLDKHVAFERSRPRARLIFALDATASREPTWDAAATLTGAMFGAIDELNAALDIKLTYYRGVDEHKETGWISDMRVLTNAMSSVRCAAGKTQIGRILRLAQRENASQRTAALVFIGDAMEESADELVGMAGQLGCPAFMFQEGDHQSVTDTFTGIARASGGACCKFNEGSAKQLAELLGAVAAFAIGGRPALEQSGSAAAIKLLQQLR